MRRLLPSETRIPALLACCSGPAWGIFFDFGWRGIREVWNRSAAMRCRSIGAVVFVLACLCRSGLGQGTGGEFQLTKITKNLITSPQFTYTGAQLYTANQRDRWLEVEAEFTSTPQFSDELTLRYYVLVAGKLLTGEVTHGAIAAGREHRSVMYASPNSLSRVAGTGALSPSSFQNIAVQIVQQGAVKDELSLVRAPAQWYKAVPAVPGLLFNKNETPFAPLYWDRYEQIKPTR